MTVTAPYGTWMSPISAAMVGGAAVNFSEIISDEHLLYWLERRPQEKGRQVIMCRDKNRKIVPLTLPGYSLGSRVHEYGGGCYTVKYGVIYFSNDHDQRLYRQVGDDIVPLTPEPPQPKSHRYADGVVTPNNKYWIGVRERHMQQGVINEIVAVATNGSQEIKVLVEGCDFYSSIAINPRGDRIAWISWNLPNMPWDSSELWTALIDSDSRLTQPKKIAGAADEAVSQPRWNKNDDLYFLSDRSGRSNLYVAYDGNIQCVCEIPAECAYPPWIFGVKNYDFLSNNRIAVTITDSGVGQIGLIENNQFKAIDTEFCSFWPYIAVDQNQLFFIASSPYESSKLIKYHIDTKQYTILKNSTESRIEKKYLSIAQAIDFPSNRNQQAHGFYYPPQNSDYCAPKNEKPPLIVICHGGPTAATNTGLSLKIQYWTSRGFGVLDVNYSGSTGYGRAYRESLNGQWGVVDVADCVRGAKYLVAKGLVDVNRLIIRGSSAGGFTVLCALTFYNIFAVGASYYGVVDLLGLLSDTHKFEAEYLNKLVGPYPQQKETYALRSPINHTEHLNCPIIFLQGLQDKVVPPSQAEAMMSAMDQNKIPYAYVTFPNEGHGFRQAENMQQALESEYSFYTTVLDIPMHEKSIALAIKHAARLRVK